MLTKGTWKNYLAGMVSVFNLFPAAGTTHTPPTNSQQLDQYRDTLNRQLQRSLSNSDAENIAEYWHTTGNLLKKGLTQVQNGRRKER